MIKIVSKSEDKNSKDPMSATRFRDWRRAMGLKQKDAADLLGLKKRMIQYYEKGARDGKSVTIPKSVRLACYALKTGVGDYDGEHSSKLDLTGLTEDE
ncbi:helix-turn-helix domain-containing protein [Cohaesibacter celericrescens]|nr:helix-turn-helix transcriptional regulator [Cohaesibacter celericrescens]